MPMGISLRQQVTVYPPDSDDPNNPVPGSAPFTLRCRFQEGTEVVTDQHGREVVSSRRFFSISSPMCPRHPSTNT